MFGTDDTLSFYNNRIHSSTTHTAYGVFKLTDSCFDCLTIVFSFQVNYSKIYALEEYDYICASLHDVNDHQVYDTMSWAQN